MAYLLALDQGTTSSRALIFDTDGVLHALAQQEIQQFYPQPGWVEHDPEEILQSQLSVASEALKKARLAAIDIAAIGITNQRETIVLWDRRSGQPCRPALVWQDRRTAERCDALRASGHEQQVRDKTGLPIDPYFSASKLQWLLDSDADLRRRAERGELACGTIDSWLLWHLTDGAVHATDATNASRTMLFDIHQQHWDSELTSLWQIPAQLLPEVVDSSGVCGVTTKFGAEIPIAGIAGDQQAALFGQACFDPGMSKCTFGTGCFVLMNTGATAAPSANGLLTTVASRLNNRVEYALEGSVFMGGATVQWLRDGLGIIDSAKEIEALAASVEHSDGVVFVPAFTGLGAPHWDPHARALLIGMTRGSQRGHIARAALDGIAWQVADVVAAMASDAGFEAKEIRVDGGASNNRLLMQLQADYANVPLVRPVTTESTAYGAAMLAGLGVGVFSDRAAVAEVWHSDQHFKPALAQSQREQLQRRWHEALSRAGGWDQVQ